MILSSIHVEEIITLTTEGIIPSGQLENVYSGTSDEILEKLMFSSIQNPQYLEEKEVIQNLIRLGKYDDATNKINDLKINNTGRPKWLLDLEKRISFAKS